MGNPVASGLEHVFQLSQDWDLREAARTESSPGDKASAAERSSTNEPTTSREDRGIGEQKEHRCHGRKDRVLDSGVGKTPMSLEKEVSAEPWRRHR